MFCNILKYIKLKLDTYPNPASLLNRQSPISWRLTLDWLEFTWAMMHDVLYNVSTIHLPTNRNSIGIHSENTTITKITAGQKIKKVQAKKKTREIKYIQKNFFSWNCILLAVLNFFPFQKLILGHFWYGKKWNLAQKIFREIDLFDFTSFFFWPGLF